RASFRPGRTPGMGPPPPLANGIGCAECASSSEDDDTGRPTQQTRPAFCDGEVPRGGRPCKPSRRRKLRRTGRRQLTFWRTAGGGRMQTPNTAAGSFAAADIGSGRNPMRSTLARYATPAVAALVCGGAALFAAPVAPPEARPQTAESTALHNEAFQYA